jgi:nucleoside-diphosphate-sugar epimerase
MLLRSIFTALRDRAPLAMTPGEQLRDFLHVDDAVEAVASVLGQRLTGTFNLASGESRSVRTVADRCASIAGRPDLLRLGALSYRAHEIFDYRLDPGALRAALGWAPRVDLDTGLERLWRQLSCS